MTSRSLAMRLSKSVMVGVFAGVLTMTFLSTWNLEATVGLCGFLLPLVAHEEFRGSYRTIKLISRMLIIGLSAVILYRLISIYH